MAMFSSGVDGTVPIQRQGAKIIEPPTQHDLMACEIVDAAFTVHTTLGPGLLESVYEQCLACELEERNIAFQREIALPVTYRNHQIDAGFRMDLAVGGLVVMEVKATEKIHPVHEAQLATYLKLSRHQLGLLINFNVVLIIYDIKRRVRSQPQAPL